MRIKLLAATLGLVFLACAGEWQMALPGYRYKFPRDHFSHPDYRIEWWYYTGNLRAKDGHRFGFELTFFREAVATEKAVNAVWTPDQMYLAHLALSDLDAGEFYHTERLNRAGPGLAGASLNDLAYWNGNWQVRWVSAETGKQELQAVCEKFALRLELNPAKPFVIQGKNGVSQKAPEPGRASHYVSFTRLAATGTLTRGSDAMGVTGLAWMDHEFFTEQMDNTQAGWDWFAIQLENNEELMLYRLRKKSGQGDPYSSGTFVDAAGKGHHLAGSDFVLSSSGKWTSPVSGTAYPLSWRIDVPLLNLRLTAETRLKAQELNSKDGVSPSYWEGAMEYSGVKGGQPVRGAGYLEMTGYDKALQLGQK